MKVSKLVIAIAAGTSVAAGTAFGQAGATIGLQQPDTFTPFAAARSVPTEKPSVAGARVQQPDMFALPFAEDSAAPPDNKVVKENRQTSRQHQGQRVARSRWGWMW